MFKDDEIKLKAAVRGQIKLMFSLLLLRVPFKFYTQGQQLWYENKVDHTNESDTRTYKQKYFANFDYTVDKKSNVLLFYIGGEAALGESSVELGSVTQLAAKTNAAIFGLEHRFFGESVPTDDLTVDNLKYLTIHQAIEDLASFITDMKKEYCLDQTKCKTAVIGGSYPGDLSSWFRLKHPELADASWSSSAPVEAKADFFEYDAHQADVIKKHSEECYNIVFDTFNYIENKTYEDLEYAKRYIWQKFGLKPELRGIDEASMLYMLADVLATPVQYRSYYVYLEEMCDALEDNVTTYDEKIDILSNTTNSILKAEGSQFLMDFPLICSGTSKTDTFKDTRAWTWMTCKEVGYFQTASGKLRSKNVNLSYWQYVCKSLFQLKDLPDTDATNKEYGGKNPTGTKTVFVNGNNDPWSMLGIEENQTSLNRTAYVVEEGHHCDDLRSPSDSDSLSLRWTRQKVISDIYNLLTKENEDNNNQGSVPAGAKAAIISLGILFGIALIVIGILIYKCNSHDNDVLISKLDSKPML